MTDKEKIAELEQRAQNQSLIIMAAVLALIFMLVLGLVLRWIKRIQ